MDSVEAANSSQHPEYVSIHRKLDLPALAAAGGVLWGAAVLLVGLINLAVPTYGQEFLAMVRSLYPFYGATGAFPDLLIGAVIAVVDGIIAGFIFGWLYNRFARR